LSPSKAATCRECKWICESCVGAGDTFLGDAVLASLKTYDDSPALNGRLVDSINRAQIITKDVAADVSSLARARLLVKTEVDASVNPRVVDVVCNLFP
jgi:hypothetical protein